MEGTKGQQQEGVHPFWFRGDRLERREGINGIEGRDEEGMEN
jgi:hypothetical protein